MVGGRTGRLDDINILAPDILLNFNARLAVGKGADVAQSQGDSDARTDRGRQLYVRIAGEYFHQEKGGWLNSAQNGNATVTGGSDLSSRNSNKRRRQRNGVFPRSAAIDSIPGCGIA